jgi:menaquinone reductase, integral membrane subunit
MDTKLIPCGLERAPFWKFLLGLTIAGAVILWGVYAMVLCWVKGLNQTNMNDYYGFALWIWADLAVIALGGGAFFTGLLKYIIGKDELKYIINYAVLIGFICYSSALLILTIDVGQPMRFWFIFWHANVHSMLTEVAFCLSCYFAVLTIEYLPLILENPQVGKVPFFRHLGHHMHGVMAIFAATGAFLSFFHQGSLGGVSGVLFGRPFAYREHILIWPYTFFLYTWSAAAFGPTFTLLILWLTEKVTGKTLVKANVVNLVAKISGWMIVVYMLAKTLDTCYWAVRTVPRMGFNWQSFFQNNPFYGNWILIAEIVLGGWVPGLLLIYKPTRHHQITRTVACLLSIIGISLNRWVMVLQTMAAPVLPFDGWALYFPSWQEVATTILPIAYGVALVMISYRYLPLFPQEKELNPAIYGYPAGNGTPIPS